MSNHVTSTASLWAGVRQQMADLYLPEWDQLQQCIFDGLKATDLVNAAARLRAASQLDATCAQAVCQQELEQLPPVSVFPEAVQALFASANPKTVAEHQAATSQLLAGPAEIALDRLGSLAEAIEAASLATAQVERQTITEGLASALSGLGYYLQRAEGEYSSAIEAARGHDKVLVTVENFGQVTSDWVGLAGDHCHDRQAQLAQAASQRGINLSQTQLTAHHDPRGGQTVAAAARQHARSLAHGAVIYADQTAVTKRPDLYCKPAISASRVRS